MLAQRPGSKQNCLSFEHPFHLSKILNIFIPPYICSKAFVDMPYSFPGKNTAKFITLLYPLKRLIDRKIHIRYRLGLAGENLNCQSTLVAETTGAGSSSSGRLMCACKPGYLRISLTKVFAHAKNATVLAQNSEISSYTTIYFMSISHNHNIATQALVVALKSPSRGKTAQQVILITVRPRWRLRATGIYTILYAIINCWLIIRTFLVVLAQWYRAPIYGQAIKRGFNPNAVPLVIKDEYLKGAHQSGHLNMQTSEVQQSLTQKARLDGYGSSPDLFGGGMALRGPLLGLAEKRGAVLPGVRPGYWHCVRRELGTLGQTVQRLFRLFQTLFVRAYHLLPLKHKRKSPSVQP
ncbi:uncharacterized protein BDR25DRAFT_363239 [Lindgomyces ingoldianus]|uniref:Uncharacterized protein n=1 Tax=Lindgomyces ingoldianus TaxID=673940 RepID=A0ACB6Q7X3_9PLEO|nr:uncharacterized protein BDR25DRAFT_363239 [Lindgomyces ingoldianus]KAF2463033.1 hypothetical protein BDR25DRAFT_363239 [Lindgomyces ingoldianus]